MNLTHYDLRQYRHGQIIGITPTSGAIARLLEKFEQLPARATTSIRKTIGTPVRHATAAHLLAHIHSMTSSGGIALLANVSARLCSSGHKVSATWCRFRGMVCFMTCCIPGELGRPFARRYAPLQRFAACGSGVSLR
ncbi:hypothetical protein ACVDG5_035175 [Mesorhizobium sp. ORM6]